MRYAIMLIGAFLTAAIVLVILVLVDKAVGRRKAKTYLQILGQYYSSDGMLATLNRAKDHFSKRSVEHIAIDKAIRYLSRSILRDYKTAFGIIERGFPQKEVKAEHSRILQMEQDKKISLLRLPEGRK